MSWELLAPDKILKRTELSDFTDTEMVVPKEFSDFFGSEGERLTTIFQEREYPAYLVTESGNATLKWSKVLIRKLREAYPQFESWFTGEVDGISPPRLEIAKTNDLFKVRLIIGNEDTNNNEDEKKMSDTNVPTKNGSGLKELLCKWITGYPNYYPRDFRFSFKDVINEEIPAVIESFEGIKAGKYKVHGFAGDNQWAEIPWVKVIDKSIQRISDEGLYLAYILAMDSRKLYMAIVYEDNSVGVRSLSEKAAEFRERINTGNYQTNHKEVLLGNATLVSGIVCYREYTEAMPEDFVLEAEFEDFREMYHACLTVNTRNEDLPGGEEQAEAVSLDDVKPKDVTVGAEIVSDQSEDNEQEEQNIQVEDGTKAQVIENDQASENGPIFEDSMSVVEIDNAEQKPEEDPNMDLAHEIADELEKIQVPEKATLETPKSDLEISNTDAGVFEKKETERILKEETNFQKQGFKHYPLENKSLPQYLQSILAKMGNKGFYYPAELIKSYYLSIKSKPFVMISGRVGSGKTTFPRLFAEVIGATAENGRYQRVLVGKNWEDDQHLFGTLDGRGHFIPGPVMKLLKSTKEYPEKPHFLLLDEMDQSPVEDYLRILLEGINGNKEPFMERDDFGSDIAAFREYGGFSFPDNLYIIGTINAGPGSHPISSRVIDSGNTIEMPLVEISVFPNYGSTIGENDWENSQFKIQNKGQGLPEILEKLMHQLNEVQKLLIHFNRPMGYRGKNEILAYGINSGVEGLFTENEVIDLAIVQRILPALDCEEKGYQEVLKALACFLLADRLKESLLKQNDREAFCRLYKKLLDAEGIPCPRSGQQILKRLMS